MPPDVRHQVAGAFARALSVSFFAAAPCLATTFVLVLFLEEKPLRGRVTGPEAAGEPAATVAE